MWWDVVLHNNVDGVVFVRAFYLLSALLILLARFTPSLRDKFLDYGARQVKSKDDNDADTIKASTFTFLAAVARVQVSHTRFSDFYVLSLICLAFWVSQIYTDVVAVKLLRESMYGTKHGTPSQRVTLCFLLFAIQSLRRLYECLALSKGPSSSSMWIGHYLIGLAFYFFTNIAIFIEHIPNGPDHSRFNSLLSPAKPSITFFDQIASPMFVIAAVEQHQYHRYLASLKKYTLPDERAFKNIVAPHYTAECLIYLSLSILSAPPGQYINKTMLCALIFVVVNLGITAEGTKKWMLGRFPECRNDVESRWRMIPMVF